MYVRKCVCQSMRVHVCACVCLHVCVGVCMCTCVRACACVCMYISTYSAGPAADIDNCAYFTYFSVWFASTNHARSRTHPSYSHHDAHITQESCSVRVCMRVCVCMCVCACVCSFFRDQWRPEYSEFKEQIQRRRPTICTSNARTPELQRLHTELEAAKKKIEELKLLHRTIEPHVLILNEVHLNVHQYVLKRGRAYKLA